MDGKLHNIVFDVGMVLIDFCWEKHCRNLGFDDAVIRKFEKNMINSPYWGQLDEGTIEEADAIRGFIDCMPEYRQEIERFWQQPEKFVEEYPYAAPMIAGLKERGYKVYLLSNYPLNMYRLHWPSFRFYSMVDGYVVSAVEKLKKPDRAIYKLLCSRYHLSPSECLFVDDRQVNVEAALKVGMEAVLFEGYSDFQETLRKKLAELKVPD